MAYNPKENPRAEDIYSQPMLRQYVETMLWSSNDWDDMDECDNPRPMDENYSLEDLAPETIKRCQDDCLAFEELAQNILTDEEWGDLEDEDLGHDFWLTRNRHGAGFWDGDYPKEVGSLLTDISHSFPEVSPYVGDDGRIYLA